MSERITSVTLSSLGVAEPDSALSDTLSTAVNQARAAGLIAPCVEGPAEVAVATPDAIEVDGIKGVLDDEADEQIEAWDDVSAVWHAAFTEFKTEFAECREATDGGTNLCAHQFRYEMQVNHVTTWLARHTAKTGEPVTDDLADEVAATIEGKTNIGSASKPDKATKPARPENSIKTDKSNGNGSGTSGTSGT